MKTIAAAALLLVPTLSAAGSDPWFDESSYGMHELVAQGYQVVGFSATTEANRIYSGMLSLRYVLQRVSQEGGVEVYQCTQKLVGGEPVSSACFSVKRL